ncbi:MFS transporter [Thermococcus sp.]|uniref:MFS transporter n=1 Tax=Thermococcus sp. TaxID=35749 RepID=UPI0026093395|nr:MFS transporter [Thermococcus sp.]
MLSAYFLNSLALAYLIGYYLNVTLASIGGPALLGLFATINNVFAGVLPVVIGAFSDFHGRKRVILICVLSEGIGLVVLALIMGFKSTLTVLPAVMVSVAFIASSPAMVSLMGESVPRNGMGKTMSLLFLTNSVAGILSYLTFGSLAGAVSDHYLFLLSGLLVMASLLFYLRVSETVKRKVGGGIWGQLNDVVKGIGLIKEPSIKLFMIYVCFEFFVSSIASPFVPVFLRRVYSLSVPQISWLYSVIGFVTLAGAFVAGYIVDRIGSLNSLILRDSLSVPFLLIFALAPFPLAFLFLAVLAFIEQLNVASNRYVVESTIPEHRGIVLGFRASLARLSAVPAPSVGAILWGFDPKMTFILPALLTPVWNRNSLYAPDSEK